MNGKFCEVINLHMKVERVATNQICPAFVTLKEEVATKIDEINAF